jgi:bifunctional non-homologous end joining protein LigD
MNTVPPSKRIPAKNLKLYRAKRSAESTPEPMGSARASRPRLFVIQKHAARRLHYDFRLEWGGTLWSWAVPKGPSLDPKEKRLAVQVEDHPVEYADFEGVIPTGNYGAGGVIVWDRGLWTPIDDPADINTKGSMHFELKGYKLKGEWILVKTKRDPKEWLLMKKADAYSRTGDAANLPETSVLSGLTVEEIQDGADRVQGVIKNLKRSKLPERRIDPMKADLMLAETTDKPFTKKDWIFELKIDGYRLLAGRDANGKPTLRSRNRHDYTQLFPEIARVLAALPFKDLVIDGEVAVLDERGKSEFQRLQKRAQLRKKSEIEKATVELPATFFAFDLLGVEGYDTRGLPLLERKKLLKEIVPSAGAVRYTDHVATKGEAMFEKVRELGLEGIMAKKADSLYKGGRWPAWLKIRVEKTGDFVVCGYTVPGGARQGFGALHLGAYRDGELWYAGRVGTGFNEKQLVDMHRELAKLQIKKPPCKGPVPTSADHKWVKPEWVVEVRYKEVTSDGLLRHPAFLRVRDDKEPEDCVWQGPPPEAAASDPPPALLVEDRPKSDGHGKASGKVRTATPKAEKTIAFSNLDKVFWPEEGYTKRDLIEFYKNVFPWMQPYLADRPLVLTRYPDGIAGKSFYQKNAPDFFPEWVRTEDIWSGSSERDIRYLVADDLESLLYIVNTGAIPLHLWMSRASDIQHPDWCLLDLDPKTAPFAHVVELAKASKQLCDRIGLPAFIKTSGATGLHVLIPLAGKFTYDQSRTLGHLLARVIEREHRDIATTARSIPARKGKVYLDFLQNRHGQLMVAPFSVRPLPVAPVSTSLEWSEVNAKLDPKKFTIRTVLKRLEKKGDPLAPLLTTKPDLMKALATLSELT